MSTNEFPEPTATCPRLVNNATSTRHRRTPCALQAVRSPSRSVPELLARRRAKVQKWNSKRYCEGNVEQRVSGIPKYERHSGVESEPENE